MDILDPSSFDQLQPVEAKKNKRSFLRSNANFSGLLMLVLVVSFQLAFPIVLAVCVLFGIVSWDAVNLPYLGLGNTAYLIIYTLAYVLAMGAPLLLLLGRRGFNPLSPTKRVHVGVGTLGFVTAVGVCMLANVITSYLLALLSEVGIQAPPPPQMMVNTPVSFVLNLVVMAVLPALPEELVFRGCVLRLLRSYGDLFAVVVSSVLFGLMHGNIRQIPFAIIVGLVLGWLYVITDNIWMSILVHFTNNAISVVCEYLEFSMTSSEAGALYFNVILRLIGAGLVALGLLMIFFRRRLELRKNAIGLSFWNRVYSLITAPAFVGSVALFIVLMLLEM